MPTLYEGLGTEELLDYVDLILRQKLNTEIGRQQEIGDTRDEARSAALGMPVQRVVLEEVPQTNFHVGRLPSFIQTEDRIEYYPLVASSPEQTVPDAEDALADQYSIFQNAITIDVFARANPTEGSEIAWRRAERMSEAIHQVVSVDRELRRVVAGVSGPLFVRRTQPWSFPAQDGHGENWWWYGIGRTYQVKNYSTSPLGV